MPKDAEFSGNDRGQSANYSGQGGQNSPGEGAGGGPGGPGGTGSSGLPVRRSKTARQQPLLRAIPNYRAKSTVRLAG